MTVFDSGDGHFSATLEDSDTTYGVIDGGFSIVAGGQVWGRDNARPFTNTSGSTLGSEPPSLTSTFTTGSAASGIDLEITQKATYQSGDQSFKMTWTIKNNGDVPVDVVPRVVADLSPGGDSSGFGLDTESRGAVNWDFAGFAGASSSDAGVRIQEAGLSAINATADQPNADFASTSDPGQTDAAVGLQWGVTPSGRTIAVGDTTTVSASFHFARLISASPTSSFQQQGQSQQVTVAVQDPDGAPKTAYSHLTYMIDGANPHGPDTVTTDGAGVATIGWTGTNAGTDTLTIFDDANANGTREADEAQRVVGSYQWFTPPVPPDAADAMAAALSGQDGLVTGASWVTEPPGTINTGPADKVWSGALGGFPSAGSTFALMTTGDANRANHSQEELAAANAGNSGIRGANDVSILKVELNVPADASCLAVNFQFLSEEFDGSQSTDFNDAFLVELDANDWSVSGNAILAPHNFAFDSTGNPISVNSTGVAQMTTTAAPDTVYASATQPLQATSPISPGAHSVYFSIFDARDSTLDTAAFIDSLRTGTGTCAAGTGAPGSIDKPPDTNPNPNPNPDPNPNPNPNGPPELPAPVIGTTANAVPEKGTVLVKLPAGTSAKRAKALGLPGGAQHFIPLAQATQVPMGSTFDTKKGTVGLSTAVAPGETTIQKGSFSQGLFVVSQPRKNPLTTLSMTGGGFGNCGRPVPKGGAPKVTAARKRSRRLFSSVKGRFRTRGRNSSATVRGTQWTMTDTCAGTKTTVKQGTVVVRDFTLKKNHVVKKGQTYFAKAPKKKGKRHFGR